MTELLQLIDVRQLLITIFLVLCVYFAIFMAVIVDLWSGLRRSRRLGIQLKSKGLRSSLRKFNDYIVFVIIASIVDLLLYAFGIPNLFSYPPAPYLTLLIGIIPIAIEGYSVYEKSDKKRKHDIEVALDNIIELAKTKGDTTEILDYLSRRLPQSGLDHVPEEPLTPDYPND